MDSCTMKIDQTIWPKYMTKTLMASPDRKTIASRQSP